MLSQRIYRIRSQLIGSAGLHSLALPAPCQHSELREAFKRAALPLPLPPPPPPRRPPGPGPSTALPFPALRCAALCCASGAAGSPAPGASPQTVSAGGSSVRGHTALGVAFVLVCLCRARQRYVCRGAEGSSLLPGRKARLPAAASFRQTRFQEHASPPPSVF